MFLQLYFEKLRVNVYVNVLRTSKIKNEIICLLTNQTNYKTHYKTLKLSMGKNKKCIKNSFWLVISEQIRASIIRPIRAFRHWLKIEISNYCRNRLAMESERYTRKSILQVFYNPYTNAQKLTLILPSLLRFTDFLRFVLQVTHHWLFLILILRM